MPDVYQRCWSHSPAPPSLSAETHVFPVYTSAKPVHGPTAPPALIVNTKLLKLSSTHSLMGEIASPRLAGAEGREQVFSRAV